MTSFPNYELPECVHVNHATYKKGKKHTLLEYGGLDSRPPYSGRVVWTDEDTSPDEDYTSPTRWTQARRPPEAFLSAAEGLYARIMPISVLTPQDAAHQHFVKLNIPASSNVKLLEARCEKAHRVYAVKFAQQFTKDLKEEPNTAALKQANAKALELAREAAMKQAESESHNIGLPTKPCGGFALVPAPGIVCAWEQHLTHRSNLSSIFLDLL